MWAGQVFIEAVADEMFWWDSALAQCGSRCGSSHLTVFGVFYFERFIFKTADDVTKAASDIQTHTHLLACFTAATVLSLTHSINITVPVAAEKNYCVFIKLSLMLHFSANTISTETWEQPLECTPLMWLHMPLLCQLRHAQASSATWCSHVVKKKVRGQGCVFTNSRPWAQGDGQPKHWSADEMADGSNQSMTWTSRQQQLFDRVSFVQTLQTSCGWKWKQSKLKSFQLLCQAIISFFSSP